MTADKFLCRRCGKRRVKGDERLCKCCLYQDSLAWMRQQDPLDQDWEFAHCEQCGSSLDGCGNCPNTWCGNSPYQGTDWV